MLYDMSNKFIPQFKRRWLLRSLAIAGGAVLSSSLPRTRHSLAKEINTRLANPLNELDSIPNPDRPLQIVILGAGMAGLCAAYELEKRGHNCVILEAESSHIGGRVRTLRFAEGLYGEVGASQVSKLHALTHHYIRELQLQLCPSVSSTPESYYYVRNQRLRAKDSTNLSDLYNLRGSESELTPNEILAAIVGENLAKLTEQEKAEIFARQIQSATVQQMDEQSMLQWCKASGFSDEAIEMMSATSGFLGDLLYFSALSFVRVAENHSEMEEIVGGTDRLPSALTDKLESKPRMGCEVIQIERDDEAQKAAAVYREGDALKREEGDFVLCTIPFSVLSQMETPFSSGKQRAIRDLSYDSATKVLAVTRNRFWEVDDDIYGGSTLTDLPIATIRYPSDNAQAKDLSVSNSSAVLTAAYAMGSQARLLAYLSPQERHALVQQNLSKVHPQVSQQGTIQQLESWSWDNHRWSLGAWSFMKPYQHQGLYEHIISPEGRVYFAGEHTSTNPAWMQSALESSLQAVAAMLAEAQRSSS